MHGMECKYVIMDIRLSSTIISNEKNVYEKTRAIGRVNVYTLNLERSGRDRAKAIFVSAECTGRLESVEKSFVNE